MRKIPKKTYALLEQLQSELYEIVEEQETLMNEIEDELKDTIDQFEDSNGNSLAGLRFRHKKIKERIESHMETIIDEAEDYQAERSEKWHESESAEYYEEWLDNLIQYRDQVEELELDYSIKANKDELIIEDTSSDHDFAELPEEKTES